MTPGLYNYKSTKYDYMEDEDVVEIARNGDALAFEYLISKYKKFVIAKSAPYFLIGGERDDIIQEGMIGLFQAVRDFDEEKLIPFIYFVELCIKRQIITAVKTATRKKHGPLNHYVSLNKTVYREETEISLIDIIEEDRVLDPMELYINGEEFEKMEKKINSMLTKLEFEIFRQYIDGKTYEEISFETNRDAKCIDNALQRVKRKFNNRNKR